ncbi:MULTISPECIES: acetyl-CoA carboxylase biotin carboxylase subunit [unclassified Rossellomorea]|uniref:acetyl-CoA carboxylase biotin carboxylase subunit n=1 Tax=unclassified Rossellomorea TaxID=2837526 RepID=UPI0020C72D7B|nr:MULTISPECIES: acetyl-CoA carboxylase biotin carboxylase subunit [unclassified Rossellomorea]UTE75296.1 acetyl-CoA carboxylase biotin carboxylase subunit [Rossellomorea sp. KS-H15a]WGG47418.1 acetyl-CoA carboxylase biotin carboxylase subunit [Rossellomorea sp. DA94]
MQKILIANRGEIASRIIKTCKQLNIQTVAVYSDADQDMPFVKEADVAFRIGESQVNRSYLVVDNILDVAKKEKVDGIHPGYGLLSENADFAKRVTEEGITFIGPAHDIIEKMGDKVEARRVMQDASVPVVPGSDGGVDTIEAAKEVANDIGYPVMLKASGGGGGIGMIRCENEQALVQSFDSTKNRAKAYFGKEEVFLEKCIENARHVEVQIFGDHHGNLVHLFERNCSVQRRNQKVIEESPSPALSQETKEKMFTAAIKAGKAVNYTNAGTVEFIVDEEENFYFLEMNTRLQVEHPVTETITGLDLVKWQLLVASGEPLPLCRQEEIQNAGHAIEFRVYAEDPKTFYPSPGKLTELEWGQGEGVRIDSGYEKGNNVTPFYDPMISKCIIQGNDRQDALDKAKLFFAGVTVEGVKTNVSLFRDILEDNGFKDGSYTTKWLQDFLTANRT